MEIIVSEYLQKDTLKLETNSSLTTGNVEADCIEIISLKQLINADRCADWWQKLQLTRVFHYGPNNWVHRHLSLNFKPWTSSTWTLGSSIRNKVATYTRRQFDHLYEPALRKTCIRREVTYEWLRNCLHFNYRSLLLLSVLFVVVVALFVFGGLNFDLVFVLTRAFLAFLDLL